jgi:hypothetical protein
MSAAPALHQPIRLSLFDRWRTCVQSPSTPLSVIAAKLKKHPYPHFPLLHDAGNDFILRNIEP